VTEKDEYDFGSAPHGPLLRKTVASYQSFGANSIFARPCQVIVYDGSGTNRIAETDYLYDGGTSVCGAAGTTSVASVSNLPTGTHDETNYGPTSTAARGNATTVTKQCFPGCANAVTTYTYDETGQVVSMKDACGNAACSDMTGTNHTTTYSYADSYTVLSGGVNVNYTPSANTNAFLTQITDPLGHTQNFTYDFNNGQLTVSRDPNALSTTYIYNNSLARPTQSNSPDGGQTTLSYNDDAPSPSVTTSKKIDSTKTLTTAGVLDGLGHVVQTKLCEDGLACTQPIMTDMAYDGLGRVSTKSNPHRSGSAPTDGTTTFFYDALGRSCLVVPPDGTLPTGNVCPATAPANDVFTTYSGNTTSITDQASKARTSISDGLGRLTQVFEDPSGLNYESDYTYDTLDNLLTVNQKGNDPSSANWRTRTFAYDSLSRLTSSTNPEANTQPVSPFAIVPTTYAYDANGNLSTKTAPAPNQSGTATVTTTYSYDVLNRLGQKSFSDSTPTVKYGYDAVAPAGCTLPTLTIGNGIGRRTGMCDGAGAEAWSYDITAGVGWKLTDARTTNSVTPSPTIVQNNLAGSAATLTYPSGRIITYAFDAAARPLSAIDSTGPINYATAAAYAPTGALSSLTNGASVVSTFYFNNRLQPCRISAKSSGTAPANCTDAVNIGNVLDFNYNFSVSTANNGNVTAITNNRDTTRSQSFTYDSLNRIATAKTTSTSGTTCWDESLGYDPWGNLLTIGRITGYSCSNEELLNASATPQNRVSGDTYDTAGNLTVIPAIGTYTYNAENQLTTTAGVTYTYDGDGKRVGKSSGKLYWYGMGSDPLDETDATGNTNNASFNEYIFFGGKRIARRDYSSNVNYYFADHLGTARIVANSSGTVLDDSDFFPFGGERVVSSSSGNSYKFTGKERDSESGLDNFGARYDSSSMGRFMSPDPKILSIRHLVNPQKWNKYAYTINNPLRYFDPNGMEEIEVQLRAFIPQQSVRDPIGRTFLGDNRTFSTNPDASSRTSITVRIETDASKRANPIISATSSAGQTVQVGADGHFDHIVTANTGLPSVTGGRDANGNVVLNLQQNTKNPLEPQLLTPGIKADLNVTIPQSGSSVTAAGTTSGFPGIELNVTPDGQPTTNIPLNDPGPNGSALGLLSTNTVLVSKPLPPPPPPCETDRNRKCQ
jgi:RHS repeat-associated protein